MFTTLGDTVVIIRPQSFLRVLKVVEIMIEGEKDDGDGKINGRPRFWL